MNTIIISFLVGIGLIITHVIFATLLVRRVIPNSYPPVINHAISAMLMAGILMIISLCSRIGIDMLLSLSILMFGVSVYLFIFGAVYKSLSLRFLIKALSSNGICISELDNEITTASFQERALILLNMGLIDKSDAGYCISEKGKKLACKLIIIRHFFGIRSTGLYKKVN